MGRIAQIVIRQGFARRFPPGAIPGERYCRSGDLFRTDEEGWLYFVARRDDIIKSRGEKVSPREVENVLYGIDGVLARLEPALSVEAHVHRPMPAELRAELLPKAPRIDPQDLVELGETYARSTGYPIQYQWTLLDGINDTPEELDGIVRLLSGKYAIMNMIPYNTIPDLPYRRPAWEKAADIARQLHRRGILTKLRNSAGQDVDGGCGQLRARKVPDT